MANGLFLSPEMLERMMKSVQYTDPALDLIRSPYLGAFSTRMASSPLFPIITACSTCDGTGEGTESTYCERCGGSGKRKTVGMDTQGGSVSLIVEMVHEKAFEPHWPTDVLVPLREIRRYKS